MMNWEATREKTFRASAVSDSQVSEENLVN